MSNKSIRKPLTVALGAAVVTSLGTVGVANAETDDGLFSMEEMSSGYLIAGAHETKDDEKDEKGGEGSCGEDKGGEGKCGEGKCGGSS